VKTLPTCSGQWKKDTKTSLVYLASPYSSPDPSMREERFQAACLAASHLMRVGLHVFSPIAHTHPILQAGKLPDGWEYWKAYDEAILSTCRALAVLQLGGWGSSRGIQGEVAIAQRLKLPTYYTAPLPENLDLLAKVIARDFEIPAPHPTSFVPRRLADLRREPAPKKPTRLSGGR
jgi:hypothetical protein